VIKQLFSRNQAIPVISLLVAGLCVVITVIAYVQPDLYSQLAFTYPTDHPWQYVSGVFLHGAGDRSLGLTVAHLMANMLLYLPYSIIVEKALGRKKYSVAFLISLVVSSVVFQVYAAHLMKFAGGEGQGAVGAGLSGIAFSMVAMGTYLIFKACKSNPHNAFRQPLTYLFIFGFLGQLFILNPLIAGMGSFFIHTAGVITGILLTIIFRATLSEYITF